MTDATTETVQPVYPPIDATKGIPPVTPYDVWTWTTPVIPQFYWNVYSAEQRIRQICAEIGKIQAYLSYFASNSNAAHWYLDERFTETETRLTKRVDALEAELKTEVETLNQLIAAETERAEKQEAVLQEHIDAEESARAESDNQLQQRIAEEETRAKSSEILLQSNLDTEIGNRQSADEELKKRIEYENERAVNAEDTLQKHIDDEVATRESADNELASTIRANKVSADEADKRIQDSLDTETANRKNGDNALGERIDAETAARAQADSNLETLINTEASNRATADNLLTQQVYRRVKATNVTAATDSHITVTSTVSDAEPDGTTVVIGDTFTPDFDKLESGLAEEITRATSAETELGGRISHETTDRETADNQLAQAVAERLKATGVIAGDNIAVQVDPDETTVTISGTASFDGITHDNTLNGTGTAESPLSVSTEAIASTLALSNEVEARENADNALHTEITSKLGPSQLIADEDVSHTLPVPAANMVISDYGDGKLHFQVFMHVVHDDTLVGEGNDGYSLKVNTDWLASYIASAVSNKLEAGNLVAGDNITLTTSDGNVTIASTASGGLNRVYVDGPLDGNGTSTSHITIGQADFNDWLSTIPRFTALETSSTDYDKRLDTLEATMPTKIAGVAHNATLEGNGTSTSPLGAKLNHTTVMSDTGNTVYPTLMHAKDSSTTINGIGFNAGDGLTAYNSDDADTGSGIRLSDATLLTLDTVAPYGNIMIFDWIKFVGATTSGTYTRRFLSSAVCPSTLATMQTQAGQPLGAIYASASGAAMNPTNFSQIVLHSPLKPSAQYADLSSNMNLYFEPCGTGTGANWVLAKSPTFDFSDGTTITFQNSGSTSVSVGHYFVSILLQV